jgi:hypothetical protein
MTESQSLSAPSQISGAPGNELASLSSQSVLATKPSPSLSGSRPSPKSRALAISRSPSVEATQKSFRLALLGG